MGKIKTFLEKTAYNNPFDLTGVHPEAIKDKAVNFNSLHKILTPGDDNFHSLAGIHPEPIKEKAMDFKPLSANIPEAPEPGMLERITDSVVDFSKENPALVGGGLGALGALGAGKMISNSIRKQNQGKIASFLEEKPSTPEGKIASFLEKTAGAASEYAGAALNPINQLGGNIIGGVAALATPTRTDEQQAAVEGDKWKNALIPGRGAYNYFKRIGNMAQHEGGYGGAVSEAVNPYTALAFVPGVGMGVAGANAVGGLAAAVTPTRSAEEQAQVGNSAGSVLRNNLLPGHAAYSNWKRLGSAISNPVQG